MDDLDTPNCPACLVRMAAVERWGAAFWKCAECGLVKL
ncbi:zf-TFIIB domain-containing protein [Cryobacterium sp. TMT3-29-2]